jgi:hypothetical protein
MTFQILPPPGSSTPIGNTRNRRSRWKLTSRLGYAGRPLALFVSKCSMDANIAARFVYRRIQSPVGTARVPARACGPVGVSSPLRSPQAFFSFRQARRVLHSPLPRVVLAGVEGGAAPLVPPPCPSPSSH